MLPHDERVTFQIVDVIHRLLRAEFEKQPSDVGPDETLRDVIRVLFMVDVFVVFAVV